MITLLIITCITPLAIVHAESLQALNQGETAGAGNYPDVPGAPTNAVQYNKPDFTPVAEMSQVPAGEPALYQYRNMTLLMNCTQNCTLIVTADPKVTPKVLWLSVDPSQTMLLTMNTYGYPIQGEAALERSLNFYWGLEPNAEVKLNAQLRLHVNQTELNGDLNRVVNASQLTWMYWNRTQARWIPVESYMDQNGYLVCNTNHFSTWTVAEYSNATEAGNHQETITGSPNTTGTGNYPGVPGGVPENAVQYNKTNVTPLESMEQVRAGEPTLFQYRNMTMLMNCTHNCSVTFTADPDVTPKVLGLSIEPNQTMALSVHMYRFPLQANKLWSGL